MKKITLLCLMISYGISKKISNERMLKNKEIFKKNNNKIQKDEQYNNEKFQKDEQNNDNDIQDDQKNNNNIIQDDEQNNDNDIQNDIHQYNNEKIKNKQLNNKNNRNQTNNQSSNQNNRHQTDHENSQDDQEGHEKNTKKKYNLLSSVIIIILISAYIIIFISINKDVRYTKANFHKDVRYTSYDVNFENSEQQIKKIKEKLAKNEKKGIERERKIKLLQDTLEEEAKIQLKNNLWLLKLKDNEKLKKENLLKKNLKKENSLRAIEEEPQIQEKLRKDLKSFQEIEFIQDQSTRHKMTSITFFENLELENLDDFMFKFNPDIFSDDTIMKYFAKKISKDWFDTTKDWSYSNHQDKDMYTRDNIIMFIFNIERQIKISINAREYLLCEIPTNKFDEIKSKKTDKILNELTTLINETLWEDIIRIFPSEPQDINNLTKYKDNLIQKKFYNNHDHLIISDDNQNYILELLVHEKRISIKLTLKDNKIDTDKIEVKENSTDTSIEKITTLIQKFIQEQKILIIEGTNNKKYIKLTTHKIGNSFIKNPYYLLKNQIELVESL